MESDKQIFEFVLKWEIGSVGYLKVSAMRFAFERILKKAKMAGKITIMEVREVDVKTVTTEGSKANTEVNTDRGEIGKNPDEFNRMYRKPSKGSGG